MRSGIELLIAHYSQAARNLKTEEDIRLLINDLRDEIFLPERYKLLILQTIHDREIEIT